MRRLMRLFLVITSAVVYWSSPVGSQVDPGIQYIRQDPSRVEGVFIDTVRNEPISFTAADIDGMLTVRVQLTGQSVTVRKGRGELHVESNRNRPRQFSTLSDDEKRILRRLVTHLETDLQSGSAFQTSAVCLLRNLSAWRTGMPLAVSVDAVMETVGDLSIPVEEMRAARIRAMKELRASTAEDLGPEPIGAITSLCSRIGSNQRGCYPTSLVPYRETCANVLVGGTTCRGRCGTTCAYLCAGQKYTQDCHSHDLCADKKGIAHPYCDWIFKAAFDDCALAPNCVDAPGVWTLAFRWATATRGGTAILRVAGNKMFTTGDGGIGTWAVTGTTFKLTFNNGCKPVYSGALTGDRLKASGTMRCRTSAQGGTWSATKTNGILPNALPSSEDSAFVPVPPRGVMSSASPD